MNQNSTFSTLCFILQYGHDALSNRILYDTIIEHRRAYYALKYVNYTLLQPSTINFMIPEQYKEDWNADYTNMRRFFIYGQSLDFDMLMNRMIELQMRVRNMG